MTPFLLQVAAECALLLNECDDLTEVEKDALFSDYCELFLGIENTPEEDCQPLPR